MALSRLVRWRIGRVPLRRRKAVHCARPFRRTNRTEQANRCRAAESWLAGGRALLRDERRGGRLQQLPASQRTHDRARGGICGTQRWERLVPLHLLGARMWSARRRSVRRGTRRRGNLASTGNSRRGGGSEVADAVSSQRCRPGLRPSATCAPAPCCGRLRCGWAKRPCTNFTIGQF